MNQNTLIGILIPFAGTALGSAMVFFMKKEMNKRLEKILLGFASGVMMAASVWSLLIPAIDMAEQGGGISWMPPAPAGHPDPAFTLHRRKTGRSSRAVKKNNYACPCGDTP